MRSLQWRHNECDGVSNHRLDCLCRKTYLVGLLICSILRGKIARLLQRECSFSSAQSNELTDQQDMFCFNHASAFYTSTMKNNELKAKTSTGNNIGNSRCHVLASRALHMSCSLGQWAHSIKNRCVVTQPFVQVQIKENIKALRHYENYLGSLLGVVKHPPENVMQPIPIPTRGIASPLIACECHCGMMNTGSSVITEHIK